MQKLLGPGAEKVEAYVLPSRAPEFSRMEALITPDREIFGWSGSEFITGTPEDAISQLIIGKSGFGKTTLLRYRIATSLKRGADVCGWDPHGSMVSELGEMVDIYDEVSDIVENAQWICNELDRRIQVLKSLKHNKALFAEQEQELLVFIDEYPAIIEQLKGQRNREKRELVISAIRRVVFEGRKLLVRSTVSGQDMNAQLFDGSGARNGFGSRYVFCCEPQQAQMAGLSQKTIEELLPLVSGRKEECRGFAILAGDVVNSPVIVNVPLTEVQDIARYVTPRSEPEQAIVESTVPYASHQKVVNLQQYYAQRVVDQYNTDGDMNRSQPGQDRSYHHTTEPLPAHSTTRYENSAIQFMLEMTEPDSRSRLIKRDVLRCYKVWCDQHEEVIPLSNRQFWDAVKARYDELRLGEAITTVQTQDGAKQPNTPVYVGRKFKETI